VVCGALQVRRAHRAAYVSNLLRRKPAARAGPDLLRPSSDSAHDDPTETDAAAPADASDTELTVNELGEVVLTQQQEAEFELELQMVLEVAQAGKKAALPLELAHLAELLPDEDSSDGAHGSSSEEEEEEETQEPVWKVISTPKAVPKVCAAVACRHCQH
jgi:hypothetical protein